MGFLMWLDERILALFTKFSHWFQRLTGRTNYFLARCCVLISVLAVLLKILNWWFPILTGGTNSIQLTAGILVIVISARIIISVDMAEQIVSSGDERKPVTEFESTPLLRILLATMAWLNCGLLAFTWLTTPHLKSWALDVFAESNILFVVFGMYFVAVTPLPPGTNKIREWLKEISAGFQKIRSPKPAS